MTRPLIGRSARPHSRHERMSRSFASASAAVSAGERFKRFDILPHVDPLSRLAAVEALVGLSLSPEWRDRADAGIALAQFVELEQAAEALRRLVLDPQDTGVTDSTVESLVRRGDAVSLRIVAGALLSAELSEEDSTFEWIESGIAKGFGYVLVDEDALAETTRACKMLAEAEAVDALAAYIKSQASNEKA